MMRCNLPIGQSDSSVVANPVRSRSFNPEDTCDQPMKDHDLLKIGDIRLQRARIFRDLAILSLLALTILAGSAVILGTFWRDIAVAESQARVVEAEQATIARLAEAERPPVMDKKLAQEAIVIILGGVGIAIILLALARPRIIIGR